MLSRRSHEKKAPSGTFNSTRTLQKLAAALAFLIKFQPHAVFVSFIRIHKGICSGELAARFFKIIPIKASCIFLSKVECSDQWLC